MTMLLRSSWIQGRFWGFGAQDKKIYMEALIETGVATGGPRSAVSDCRFRLRGAEKLPRAQEE